MSKKEKALAKLRSNPKHVRFQDLENILINLGFIIRQERTSHAVFTYPGFPPLTVPRRKPFLAPEYIKQALKLIDEIVLSEDDEE
jgi:predicted RNA binding protein YcfA (HicA-like mRNA interferase family)